MKGETTFEKGVGARWLSAECARSSARVQSLRRWELDVSNAWEREGERESERDDGSTRSERHYLAQNWKQSEEQAVPKRFARWQELTREVRKGSCLKGICEWDIGILRQRNGTGTVRSRTKGQSSRERRANCWKGMQQSEKQGNRPAQLKIAREYWSK